MFVFRGGNNASSSSVDEKRSRRVGWWGLGPLLFGGGFLVMGILMLAGSSAAGSGASGLVISGVVFLLIGVPSLALAWYIRRDIRSDDAPAPAPAVMDAQADAELRVTGVKGTAKIKGMKYLAGGSSDGATRALLDLEITTALGGTVNLQQQAQVPLAVTDKLGAGASVPVIVSSTDPSKLIIEWTGLVAPTSYG